MPETFDLDRAFDDLTRDVAGVSTGPGARHAVTTSRRRRAAGVGVAAVAALVVGGVAVTTLGDGGQRGDGELPIATESPSPQPDRRDEPAGLPTPTPLTAAVLSDATDPWVVRFTEGDSPVTPDAPCLRPGRTQPLAEDNGEFRSGRTIGVQRTYTLWDGAAQAARVATNLDRSLRGCAQATFDPTSLAVPGASVTVYDGQGAEDSTLWVAQAGDRLALLVVRGVTDAPSATIVQDVADALVAGLTYDEPDD